MGMQLTTQAFERAYEQGHQKTIHFLMSCGFAEDQAQESAQMAWVTGWQRRYQIRDVAKTLSWVNTIALNFARSVVKGRRRMEALPESLHQEAPDVGALIDAHRILEWCSPRDRNLLRERYLEGADIGDLARDHCCTRLAIRVRLHRARRAVLEKFQKKQRSLRSAAVLRCIREFEHREEIPNNA